MKAYVIAEHDVHDPVAYDQARPGAGAAIAAYGGRYIVNGLGSPELVEGGPMPKRFVVLEFPDRASAKRFYESAEYHDARTLRQSAATSRLVLVDSCLDD